jgi:hypothetical protein
VCRQRCPILKVGEIIYVDQRGDRLTVLTDSDGTMALPRLGDELTEVGLSSGQRIDHASTVTPRIKCCGRNTLAHPVQMGRNAASLAEMSARNIGCKFIEGEYLLAGTSRPSASAIART